MGSFEGDQKTMAEASTVRSPEYDQWNYHELHVYYGILFK